MEGGWRRTALPKTLTDYRQAWVCIQAFIEAVNAHRVVLRQQHRILDLKVTAWLAGFPVNNSEIVVLSEHPAEAAGETEGDAVLTNLRLLEQLEKPTGISSTNRHFQDFVGPSMDTGFRLASLSTARKMTISADLALMLAYTDLTIRQAELGHGISPLNFHYEGRFPLKGVIDGAPYPIFWLDTATDDSLFSVEDKLNGPKPVEATAIKEFCEQFLRDLGDRHMPFIEDGQEAYFQPKSDLHLMRLQAMSNYWEQEITKQKLLAEALASDAAPLQQKERDLDEDERMQSLSAIHAKALGPVRA